MPVYRFIRSRNVIGFFSVSTIILIVPLIFYEDIYCSSYIDPFLAILAATGFSMIMLYERRDKDIFFSIYIWLVIGTLVLSKDAGMLFAVFLALFYVIDYYFAHQCMENKEIKSKIVINLIISILAVFIPQIIWKWELKTTNVPINFDNKIDIKSLLNVLTGNENSYRKTVLKEYICALFDRKIDIGYTNIQINYFMLTILLAVALYCALRFLISKNKISRGTAIAYWSVPIIQLIVFLIGMCILYMYNFSEYEATRLASFSRYLNIAFLATTLMIFLLIWKITFVVLEDKQNLYGIILVAAIMLIAPMREGVELLGRENYEEANMIRSQYNTLTEKIMNECSGNATVNVISQEDSGFDAWVIRFGIRPNRTYGDSSIGVAFYEGDIWTKEKTANEWREELIEGCDYVALYKLNDYFYENFAELFADPSTIVEDGLYKVDKKSGTLYWVN